MIVRIATEGQYRLADDQVPRLEELDAALVEAVESADRDRFTQAFAELLDYVRGGELLDDTHLGASDAILPPPDVSLEEASGGLGVEGLIPDWSSAGGQTPKGPGRIRLTAGDSALHHLTDAPSRGRANHDTVRHDDQALCARPHG
jgi:hypothetical protein